MKNVLVFGTFDNIHPGHEFFLETAAKQGKCLTVIVARDQFVRMNKNKKPLHDEKKRLQMIKNHPLVFDAYLADKNIGTYSILKRLEPDLICLGHDQTALEEDLREWLKKNHMKTHIKRLPAYKREHYSSTLLNRLKERIIHE
jgi:FAD synthetase